MSELEKTKSGRGLGRGLSALLGEENTAPRQRSSGAREISVGLIRPNPNQPRRTFDVDELNSLAETIKEHGIVQPIVVRPSPTNSGEYEIIAGERRWRAAQIVGLHEVPIVEKDYDDLETLKVAIVENLQRQNLNAIEEALSFSQLMDRFGYNQQAIATTIGKSRVYVANTLRLLALPNDVQEMVKEGQITAGHARAALSADDPLAAAKEMLSKNLSVRDAEKLVTKPVAKPKKVSRETPESADVAALENDLSAVLGMGVKLKHRPNNSGSLVIDYKTLEQLDELCRRLMH
jgi:ParB family chromosome partitioning protein